MRFPLRGRGTALVVAAVTTGAVATTLAFTNTNTVPTSSAGSGSGAISGYTVSAVDYTLVTADPTKIASVAFKLNGNVPATHDTKVRVSSSGSWIDCSEGTYDAVGDKTPVTCTYASGSEPTVASATNLEVVVAQ